MIDRNYFYTRWLWHTVIIFLCFTTFVNAQPLTELEYRLTGIALDVSPSTLTVPRGVTTHLETSILGEEVLPDGAVVHATLRGPSFPGTIEITAAPGEPILLPPLSRSGIHFLEDIRLDIDEELTIPASPPEVTINVLEEILIGNVTSRPLSLDEIRELGIQFDETSFKAFNFTLAFTTESEVKEINLPMLVPVGTREERVPLGGGGLGLNYIELPGLNLPNFTIEPIMLEPVVELSPGEEIPPIPGIIVIPGNIAFLNQFFSVLLAVTNGAPDGTPLIVRNVHAEIFLPPGADSVVGDILKDPPFKPGEPEYDNPLRIAKTEAGRENIKSVFTSGPDGEVGTEDDIDSLYPQETGNAEFLVEGVREGSHIIEIEIRGILEGLPSGPVEVVGHASGAVVVRDPDFSLTFIHPNTVRAGELYELTVHLQNTSKVPANLVTVSLDPRNLSGARFVDPDESTQIIETIPPGESGAVTFWLEAMCTGQVTASTLELSGEEGIVTGRRISLRAGVSEQGVPLSPDTLLLPPSVTFLRERAENVDLTFRAVALLGEAHSIATAPRGSLPADVRPIKSTTVIQRARELSEAGYRLELSYREGADGNAEPLPEGLLLTLQDLYFDYLGAGEYDDGWDWLYRNSRQARLFGMALTDVINHEMKTLGFATLVELQKNWADTESYYSSHITVMTEAVDGQIPVVLKLTDRLGRQLGGSLDPEGGQREIPGADILGFFNKDDTVKGQFAVITKPETPPYRINLNVLEAGKFTLGIVVPGRDGELRQIIFRDVLVSEEDELIVTIQPGLVSPAVFKINGMPIEPTSEELIPDGPPEVLGVMQQADRDIDQFGRVVAILFDEPIDKSSAKDPTSYRINPATITMIPPPDLVDGNEVRNAVVQFGDRIVFLGLRDPVGPFVPRRINISGIQDTKNQIMLPVKDRLILPDPDIGIGAQLTGRIMRSDGTYVSEAEITYYQYVENIYGICEEHIITVKHADQEGRYGLDFVLKDSCDHYPFRIRARDTTTGEEGSLSTRVRVDGERITLDIILVGRGAVEGTVRDSSGALIPNVHVKVQSSTDLSTYNSLTDQNGFYRIEGIPVGPFGIEVTGSDGKAWASGTIPTSNAVVRVDVTIFPETEVAITGEVRYPDGSAASGIDVFLKKEDSFIYGTTTDEAGTFRFEGIFPDSYEIRALDRAAFMQGDASIIVTDQNTPDNPAHVLVYLAGTGSVSGTVYKHVGTSIVPVPGALIAGGTQIVTADPEGQYFIPSVPVGLRTITAADPETGAMGSRRITILTAGQESTGIDIIVEPLGKVTGHVFDASGHPVAGQEVRIIIKVTETFASKVFWVRKTTTTADGTYSFDKLELKDYTLTAVRGREVANGRARLSQAVFEDIVDLRFIQPIGRVSGRVIDETGLAVAAKVVLKARLPNEAGILEFRDAGTTISDPDIGFTFDGLFPGPFTVIASSFFSPVDATASGQLSESNPVAEDITLVLAKNTSSLHGCVLSPDGTVIEPILDDQGIPLPLSVFITSRLLRDELKRDSQNPEPEGIRVDASEGCFVSSIPLPPDHYRIEVTDERPGSPFFGLTGQTEISIGRGEDVEKDVRLLGLGSLRVEVVDAHGKALPGVTVTVRRTTYPYDTREAMLSTPTDVAPFIFDSLTEGPVSVSALVSTDPDVDVGGREELRGFGGHATGMVVRDGLQTVRVTIEAAGKVSGRFLQPDGITPTPNAQIKLQARDVPMSFGVTDHNGEFHFIGIPVGNFRVDGFDPATGRWGYAEGHLDFDGQHVLVDLELGPIGTVQGIVFDADRTEPIAGADVTLSIKGHYGSSRKVTTGMDGSFIFESVPGGAFTVTAVSPEGLSGQTEGVLETEGKIVEIEILLEGKGRVEGTVFDATGLPVAAAEVTLIDHSGRERATQAGTEGFDIGKFSFDYVPLGPFTIKARPPGALTPGDGGLVEGVIEWNGQIVTVDVPFQGTVTIGVIVSGEIGYAPVEVTLNSGGLFGGYAEPTTTEDGVILFEGIPRAPLTVSARQITPVGTTISASASLSEEDLPAPGERLVPDLELILSDGGRIIGQVIDQEGTPVSMAKVMLSVKNLNTLALSSDDGSFEFLGVPLDVVFRLEVDAYDKGRAVFDGSIDSEGVIYDLNGSPLDKVVLVLDAELPEVLYVEPQPGASAVPTDTTIVITFSEPVDTTTVHSCSPGSTSSLPTFKLLESTGEAPALNNPSDPCDDSNVVPVDVAISADKTIVILTPLRELRDTTQHTIIISRGEINSKGELAGGVRDLVGQPLEQDFIWSFVTRDNEPPTVLTVSPPDSGINIPVESVVRVTFSEPIDPSSIDETSFAVEGPAGSVQGQHNLILGNTVIVFTPTDASGNRMYFEPNSSYTVSVNGVMDPAGNVMLPQDSVFITFRTIDTIPPVIDSVLAPAGARADQSLLVIATTSDTDTTSVEFFVDGVLTAIVSEPFAQGEYRTTLVMPEKSINVAARAIDSSGNVGELSPPVTIALLRDEPPSVTITEPDPGTVVPPGSTVNFTVEATDDVAVVQMKGLISGVVTSEIIKEISPPATSTTVPFEVIIPASAPEGTLTLAAIGTDSKGQTNDPAMITLVVQDEVDPVVSILSPDKEDVVYPGMMIQVTTEAIDTSGITEITLEVSEIGFSDSIILAPVKYTTTHTFIVPIPDVIEVSTLSFVVRATDRFGREGSTQLILPVWTFAIEATAIRGLPNDPDVASANTKQTIYISAQGLNDSLLVQFTTTDDDGNIDFITMPLFAVEPDGSRGSVVVPSTASTGWVHLITDLGETLPGKAWLQIVPTLDSFSVPPGEQVEAGVIGSLRGSGFREGNTRVEFPGVAAVMADDVTDGNTGLAVTIPDGVTIGELYVFTDGGMSNGFPILGMFGLVGTASEGLALDPMYPSANPRQKIIVTGKGLSTSIIAAFTAINENGEVVTSEAFLTDVNEDGTRASVTVPATAVTGFVQLRQEGGDLFPGSAYLQVVPTLTRLIVPAGEVLQPGVVATLLGAGFRVDETKVVFSGASPVIPDSVTSTVLSVTVPEELSGESVYVVTDGGSSRALPLPGTFGLVSSANKGVPANSSEPSANIGQTITVTGKNLSTDLFVVFNTIDDNGISHRVEKQLIDISSDEMSASVTVPHGAVSASVYLKHKYGAPSTSSVFLQVVPTLISLQVPVPYGTEIAPGVIMTLKGSGFVEGATEVDFPGAGRILPEDVFNEGHDLRVRIPDGLISGTLTVVTSGGTSNGLPIEYEMDVTPPEVIDVIPSPGEIDVPVNTTITIHFSEPLNPDTLTSDTIILEGPEGPVEANVDPVFNATGVILRPLENLNTLTTYTLSVSGVEDIAGNLIASPYEMTFTTGAQADVESPEVVRVTPSGGEVAVNSVVVVEFSEPIDPATINDTTFRLYNSTSREDVEGSREVDSTGRIVYFMPLEPLAVGTEHKIIVSSGVQDVAGNALEYWNGSRRCDWCQRFRTAFESDEVSPEVVEIYPADGDEGVPTNAVIEVQMSEAVDPISVTGEAVLLKQEGGGEITGRLSLEEGNRCIKFIPSLLCWQQSK
jgi:hypothetical protein